MNIYVEGNTEAHQRWVAAASLRGMTLAQWVAHAVKSHWQEDLVAVEKMPLTPKRKQSRKKAK